MATVDCSITKWAHSLTSSNTLSKTSNNAASQVYFGGDYAAWVQFTTPAYSVTKITLWVNVVGQFSTTQNFFQLGQGAIPTSNLTNQPSTKLTNVSIKWTNITSSSQQFKADLTPNKTLSPNTTYYIKIYGGYLAQLWPNSNGVVNKVVATYSANNYYKPSSLVWNGKGQGINSASQTVAGRCGTSGYWFGGQSSTGTFYKKTTSPSSSVSMTFDASSTSTNLIRYATVSSSSASSITVSSSTYVKDVIIPAYACTCFNYFNNNANEPCYLSSADTTNSTSIGTLIAPSAKSGYEKFIGFSTSATSHQYSYTGSTKFSPSIDGIILYAVYKNEASNKSIALYNCSSSTWQTAWSNTTAKYCYGKGSTTGGITTNDRYMTGDSGYTPTQSGYAFLGWTNKSNEYSTVYNTPLDALGIDSRLYAIFFKNASESMSLALGSNGGPSLSYSTATRSLTVYKYGTGQTMGGSYAYSSGCNYTPTGNSSYKWSGWCGNSDGSGTKYSTPKAVFEAGYVYSTLYAIFEPDQVYINYYTDNDTVQPTNTVVQGPYDVGDRVILSDGSGWISSKWGSSVTFYTNYNFQGGSFSNGVTPNSTYSVSRTGKYDWVISGWLRGSQRYELSEQIRLNSNISLYPYWADSNSIVSHAEFTPITPIRKGYKFLNWNTQANGNGTAYYANTNYDTSAIDKDLTLYAIWEPEWTIKINNGTSWGDYHVWIYTGATSNNGCQQAIPYVYDGSNWKLTKI